MNMGWFGGRVKGLFRGRREPSILAQAIPSKDLGLEVRERGEASLAGRVHEHDGEVTELGQHLAAGSARRCRR